MNTRPRVLLLFVVATAASLAVAPPPTFAEDPPTFVFSWGSMGAGSGKFNRPGGIAVDPAGNVYVVDTLNDRIQKFTASGVFLSKWGEFGTGDGQFDDPGDIAVDNQGNVYVLDTGNERVQKFTDPHVPLIPLTWGKIKARFIGTVNPKLPE